MNDPVCLISAAAAVALADHERQRCEVWTRVMGYHRPVSSFNEGKKGEFDERVSFREAGGGPDPAAGRRAGAFLDV